MKNTLNRKGLVAAILFFILLVASGAALAGTGNWSNPFTVFSMGAQGAHRERGEGFEPPQRTENTTSERPAFGEGRTGNTDSVNWSQFGQVLYNVWILFATAGVIILISLPWRALRQRSRRNRATHPPSAFPVNV